MVAPKAVGYAFTAFMGVSLLTGTLIYVVQEVKDQKDSETISHTSSTKKLSLLDVVTPQDLLGQGKNSRQFMQIGSHSPNH